MYLTVPIAMFGWPVAVLAMFALMRPRQAVIWAFVLGWLFLPVASFKFPGFPAYTKVTATVIGAVIGILIFDSTRILSLRPSWMDIPIAIWCLCPFATSISNGLGAYDGLSSTFYQTLNWGVPYLIGRAYFNDLEGLKDLTLAVLAGGLIYVPLCLFETRFSPQLHHWIYGFQQQQFGQSKRWGGYRPMVFMQTGLAVGLWMAEASLVAIWLWATGAVKRIHNWPIGVLACTLFITEILCKSTGAIILMFVGIGMLFLTRWMKKSIPWFCLILLIPLYLGSRLSNVLSTQTLSSVTEELFNPARAGSLVYRLNNEDLLSAKAMRHSVFGWGGWNRSEIRKGNGQNQTVTDSLWIIALGHNGFVGLTSLVLALLLPAWITLWRYPITRSMHIGLVSLQLLALLQVVFTLDCLFNAMINPIFVLAMGGVTSVLGTPRRRAAMPERMVVNRQSLRKTSMAH